VKVSTLLQDSQTDLASFQLNSRKSQRSRNVKVYASLYRVDIMWRIYDDDR